MSDANTGSVSRFKIWSAFLVFNVIIFGSVVSIEVSDEARSPRAWCRGFSFLSLLVTIPAYAAHFLPRYRAILLNTKNELYMIATLLLLWTVLVAVVTSPTTGLAVEDDGAVALANLYYFTWAGFITGVVLLASYAESSFGINVRASFQTSNANHNTRMQSENIKAPSMAFIFWSSLMATSLIVMGTAADIYNRNCEVQVDMKEQPFCSRTVFAITTSVMSTIVCLLVITAKMLYLTVPFLAEVFLCIVLLFLYGFEVLYATSANGPGGPLGNLYYFSWISFFLCFGIGKCLHEDYVHALEVTETEYEEDQRRTTVPSLERHDVDDEEEGVVVVSNVEMTNPTVNSSALAEENRVEQDTDESYEKVEKKIDPDDDI